MFFRIYSSRLARALSAIRARRARAVENMFMRKLPRTRHIWNYRYHTKIFLLKKLYLEVIKVNSNMKQWNFKMKNLCSETLKTLINELNRPGSQIVHKWDTSHKKVICIIILTLAKSKYFVSYTIKLHCY